MKNEAGDTNEVLEETAEDTEEEGVNSEQKIIGDLLSSPSLSPQSPDGP